MRRYVNGLRYDTETATEVTSVGSDFGKSDFQWWTADLYVTKSGRWFLHGRAPQWRGSPPAGRRQRIRCYRSVLSRRVRRRLERIRIPKFYERRLQMYCSGCGKKKRLRYPKDASDPCWCTQSCAARWADGQQASGNSDAANNCCGMSGGGDCHEDWCKENWY